MSLLTGSVFISYSRRDTEVMQRIVSYLRKQGLKVWVDNEKLIPGTPVWEREIEKAIDAAHAIVVVLSPDAKESIWVLNELTLADEYKKRVFPVLVRGDFRDAIPFRLVTRQFVDLRTNEERGLESLGTALSQYLDELKQLEGERLEVEQEQAGRIASQKAQEEQLAAEKRSTDGSSLSTAPKMEKARINEPKPEMDQANVSDRLSEDGERQRSVKEPAARKNASVKPAVPFTTDQPWVKYGILGAGVLFVGLCGFAAFQFLLPMLRPSPTATPVTTEVPISIESPDSSVEFPQGQELASAYAGEYSGKVVTLWGTYTDDTFVTTFDNTVRDFESATGIDIQYEGLDDYSSTVMSEVANGTAADILVVPSSLTILSDLAAAGQIVDLNQVINPDWLSQNYDQKWLDAVEMQGSEGTMMAGIWVKVNTYSLVFYPKRSFDEKGLYTPDTWGDMMDLTEQIASGGETPWCIGIESGGSTGWVISHWIEDLMLRTTSFENYKAWKQGELKFDSPEVREAFQYLTDIWFNNDYVRGGPFGIPYLNFGDSPGMMFSSPPECWLHRQAAWITSFFPQGLEPGADYDVFYLPPIDSQYGRPVLGHGDIAAVVYNRPEVSAVIQYFSTGVSVKAMDSISPHNDFDLDWYSNPLRRREAEIIKNATTFGQIDNWPTDFYTPLFSALTEYVSGNNDLDTTLAILDESYPH